MFLLGIWVLEFTTAHSLQVFVSLPSALHFALQDNCVHTVVTTTGQAKQSIQGSSTRIYTVLGVNFSDEADFCQIHDKITAIKDRSSMIPQGSFNICGWLWMWQMCVMCLVCFLLAACVKFCDYNGHFTHENICNINYYTIF